MSNKEWIWGLDGTTIIEKLLEKKKMSEEFEKKILKEDNFIEDLIIDRSKMLDRRKGTEDEKVHRDILELLVAIKQLHIKKLSEAISLTKEKILKIINEKKKEYIGLESLQETQWVLRTLDWVEKQIEGKKNE